MSAQLKVALGVGLATLLILVGGIFFISRKSSTPPQSLDTSLLIKNDSHKIATDSATLTLVEFGDFQCPACGAVHPLVKKALTDYAGKINFVYRNFPLPQHANAIIAAEAADAAGAQGKYWEMYDKLYENQTEWSEEKDPLPIFVNYSKDLGLDTKKFEADIKDPKFKAFIEADKRDGNILGVSSTPTFFLNGQKLEGLTSYSSFTSRLDAALAK